MIARRAFLLFAVGAVAVREVAVQGQGTAKPKLYLFNIPAQPLQTALIAYAGVVGRQIIYDARLARDLRSQAVTGLFTVDTALRLLIAGTDFTVIETGQDIALVPLAEIRAGHFPGDRAGETTLVLDTLYVAVPPGARQRPDFTDYGQLLRARVRQALTENPESARRVYNARFDIWIDPHGAVVRGHVVRSSGNAKLDELLERVIAEVRVDRPPPHGMPQPIHITVIGI